MREAEVLMCLYSPELLPDELGKLKAIDSEVAEFVLETFGNERLLWSPVLNGQTRYLQLKTTKKTIIELSETFVANQDTDGILDGIRAAI